MELVDANPLIAVIQAGDPIRIQIPAAGINPVGAIKPAAQDHIGLVPSLRFDTGVDMVAGVALAIPDKADRSIDVACRVGWGETSGAGNVVYNIYYKWLTEDTVLDSAADGTLSDTVAVNTTVKGYTFTSITIPAPSSTDRVLEVQIERNGANVLDTSAGAAHVIGILFDFTAGTN